MLIAAPAAGKGTQAELISEKYHLPHISTGDILRDMAKVDSELGHYIFETLKSGKLVKDEITYQLIKDRLKEKDCQNGFIIDGFPRSLDQAIEYDKIVADLGYKLGKVIFINLPSKVLEKRVTGRRICGDCHAIYNINDEASAPHMESVCDICGGKLYQRSDDNLAAFQNRYNMYMEKTEPVIKHYQEKGVLYEVDGDKPVEDVFKQIEKIINQKESV